MGLLIEGVWYEDSQIRANSDGGWKRSASTLRNWVTRDGKDAFKTEPGRYHLYAALIDELLNCRKQIFFS